MRLSITNHPGLFTPLDFGLVGFSFACGLGVKLAQPDRPVVSLMGDGGFGMTVSELSTAVDHGINTVTLVMNNQCWGAEKAYQRDFFGGRYIGANVSSPPYDRLAELYGAAGFKAERLSEVADAVQAALACGKPAVVDISVDPDALYSFRRDSFKHRGGKARCLRISKVIHILRCIVIKETGIRCGNSSMNSTQISSKLISRFEMCRNRQGRSSKNTKN